MLTLHWPAGTAGPSAQIQYENMHGMSWAPPQNSGLPTAVANFIQDVAIGHPGEAADTITRWTEFDCGGHIAAMEAPDLLLGDFPDLFGDLR